MSARSFLMVCIAVCLIAFPPYGRAIFRERAGRIDIFALRDKEELVLTVGNRLAVAANPRCVKRAPGWGATLHDLDQYGAPYRQAAASMFPSSGLPAVLAVAAGGAAERAGVRVGDAVVAVDGVRVSLATGDGLARVEALVTAIEMAAVTGEVQLTLARGENERTVSLLPPSACAVRFQIRPDRALDARTNGWLIEVTTSLVDFTRGPDELASVLAHELAHVILEHRERTRGAHARESRAFELEADRLAVRLASEAGFRAGAASDFWRRMRVRGGAGPSGLGRHPADRDRLAAVETALRDLAANHPVDVQQAGLR